VNVIGVAAVLGSAQHEETKELKYKLATSQQKLGAANRKLGASQNKLGQAVSMLKLIKNAGLPQLSPLVGSLARRTDLGASLEKAGSLARTKAKVKAALGNLRACTGGSGKGYSKMKRTLSKCKAKLNAKQSTRRPTRKRKSCAAWCPKGKKDGCCTRRKRWCSAKRLEHLTGDAVAYMRDTPKDIFSKHKGFKPYRVCVKGQRCEAYARKRFGKKHLHKFMVKGKGTYLPNSMNDFIHDKQVAWVNGKKKFIHKNMKKDYVDKRGPHTQFQLRGLNQFVCGGRCLKR